MMGNILFVYSGNLLFNLRYNSMKLVFLSGIHLRCSLCSGNLIVFSGISCSGCSFSSVYLESMLCLQSYKL